MHGSNLKYFADALIDDGTLLCPSCEEPYLHQCNVTVFERGEDDEYTTVIAQNGADAQVNRFKSDDTCNPSSRRHGLLLEFTCEHCHADQFTSGEGNSYWSAPNPFLLGIAQHKGVTLMQWFK